MAQTVKLKRSSVAGNVPTSGQMTPGELAMNTADGKLFLRDGSDVRPIVTVDAEVTGSLNLIGNITASGDISASGDIRANEIILDGASAGITINSDAGTELLFQNSAANIISNDQLYILSTADASIHLGTQNTNSQLQLTRGNLTASSDISASGNITANSFYGDGSNLTGITTGGSGDGFPFTGSAIISGTLSILNAQDQSEISFDKWVPSSSLGTTYVDWSGNTSNPQLLVTIGGTQVLRASKGALGDNIILNPFNQNYNSIIRGISNNNLFFVKADNNRVGVNTDDPQSRFHVVGEISSSQLSVGSSIENVDNTTRITIDAIPTESISTFRSTGSLTGLTSSISITFSEDGSGNYFWDGVDDVFRLYNADTGGTNPVYFKSHGGGLDITGVGSEADPILVAFTSVGGYVAASRLRTAINKVTAEHASLDINISASESNNGSDESTLTLFSTIKGAEGNNISITTQSNGSSESSHEFFTGGSSTFVPEGGDTITNFIVLDISGSGDDGNGDTEATLRRIDFQSFLENTFISQIRDEFIALSASLAGDGASSGTGGGPQYLAADVDEDGTVGVSDILIVLAEYGTVYDPNGDRIAGKIVTSSQELPSGSRVSDSTLSAMQDVGFLTEIGGNTIDLTATLASPFIFKGSTLLGTSSKIEFQDISGDGLESSSIFLSGSEINIEKDFRVEETFTVNGNTTLNSDLIDLGINDGDRINVNSHITSRLEIRNSITASGNISSSGELIGIINGGSF